VVIIVTGNARKQYSCSIQFFFFFFLILKKFNVLGKASPTLGLQVIAWPVSEGVLLKSY
jgi:hypothetical protein